MNEAVFIILHSFAGLLPRKMGCNATKILSRGNYLRQTHLSLSAYTRDEKLRWEEAHWLPAFPPRSKYGKGERRLEGARSVFLLLITFVRKTATLVFLTSIITSSFSF